MRHLDARVAAAALLLFLPSVAQGQEERLRGRVDAQTYAAVVPLLEHARAEGLPVEPLVEKALEGVTKGASGPRVVEAVRGLSARLERARSSLGLAATEAELSAAAAALYVGAPPELIARVGRTRSKAELDARLNALAYLLQRGVAPGPAADLLVSLLRAGLADRDLLLLQQRVDEEIRSGAAPLGAAQAEARRLLRGRPDLRRQEP
jgi:hypothetical protein